jgi:non-specific serine/threonine protein kinase
MTAAWALVFTGRLRRAQGEYDGAVRVLAQGRELFHQLGEPRGIAMALYQLGAIALYRADLDQAATLLNESLAVFRQVGDGFGPPMVLEFVARTAYHQGRDDEALARAEEHLALCREIGYRWGIGFSLATLGMVAHRRGDATRAIALFQESLTVRRDMGEREGIAECLERLAGAAASSEQSDSAARLLGAAESLRELIAAPVPRASRADYERDLAEVRAALDEPTFAARWAEGRALSLEHAVEEARALKSHAPAIRQPELAHPAQQVLPGRIPGGVLTPREREVASLIALGLSNRQIASRLVVSKRTVDAHMASILAKLGFANRAQVAVWAAEHGAAVRQT